MEIFRQHSEEIGTASLEKGLSSDAVLAVLRNDLHALGFMLETDKKASGKLKRPVFFGDGNRRSQKSRCLAVAPERLASLGDGIALSFS
jgi:hypothetical protein